PLWTDFWKGESKVALEELILSLVENAAARKARSEVQEQLNALIRFWKHEALALHRARRATSRSAYPVAQKDRDILFLEYRHQRKRTVTTASVVAES
ncbi:MAG: hypothetical protein NDJ90_16035, partial [Oligoflexia bacterium]|nr:hypothetical protein [Oligoflexia bacterium]